MPPFIVDVYLSNILDDQNETHYTMYIDDSKMTVVYELIEWIKWIFSLKHCVYLTHDNSVIHELEDIKILSVLKNVRAHICDHVPCVHKKLNHLFKKLNFFVQWDGIKVPKLFLSKVNEITKKLVQKEGNTEVMKNGGSEENARPNEVEKTENNINKLHPCNINTSENQLSENLNSNTCASSKTNFNMNSSIRLDNTTGVNFNEKHSIPSAKSDFVNVCKSNTTNFKAHSDLKLNDKTVGMSNSSEVHSAHSDKYEYVHMNNINKTNSMDTAAGLNNFNKVLSPPSNENEFVDASFKISECEMKEIKTLVDINLPGNMKSNEYEQMNKSNQKRSQSVSNDKKIHDNKKIKKVPKPFSVGEILTNLRSQLNTLSTDHELNTSTKQNQCLLSDGLVNDEMGDFDQNLPKDSDVTVTVPKRKRQRKHKSRKLTSKDSKVDNFLQLPKPEGGDIPGTVKLCTPCYTKQSSHIRFASDDEDFSETNHPESDKQSEKTQHDLSKNNELVENGMEQSFSINGKEEILPMTQPNACDENDESKADNFSKANKEFSTLDKLINLHDQMSSSGNLFEYSSEENQLPNGESSTPENYDFNLSTLRALREKFPSPMVVERFY